MGPSASVGVAFGAAMDAKPRKQCDFRHKKDAFYAAKHGPDFSLDLPCEIKVERGPPGELTTGTALPLMRVLHHILNALQLALVISFCFLR